MQNFSYENEFDLHENELVGETHFYKNGFALRLVLTQMQTRTRKLAIYVFFFQCYVFIWYFGMFSGLVHWIPDQAIWV